ncbi:tRNA lysidine(34) synthetase TilS [Acidocella sp.]|uniref:tRNA lysidine(34) synthetase TilS n=1 Tax=Acidocella sp. TaxID=50710 RepID=UPI00261C3AF2|nr:tRNA lysidine(34) synthetase TilS [Acidocella sp.]
MSLADVFAATLERLLPPGLPPRLAVAVSGGADSSALALLARDYCVSRGGALMALIVDHGLRAESADEARLTALRLMEQDIPSKILNLNLRPGAAMQARARLARHEALAQAAMAAGFVHLAMGHHRDDQRETVAMRARRGFGGGEGMASWSARNDVVLIRPLLETPACSLREFLQEKEVEWVEDPSNHSCKFERVRIRRAGEGVPPLSAAGRMAQELEIADFLARHVRLYPEGYAVLDAAFASPAALGALLRTIGGRRYMPRREALSRLAQKLCSATLGGVRIVPAGRLGAGWLLAREPAACAPPVPAVPHAMWDGRFVLDAKPLGARSIGALGRDAARFRGFRGLPSLVLCGLPALRYADGALCFPAPAAFIPPMPATARPFQA